MKDMIRLSLRYIRLQRKNSFFIALSVTLSVALTVFCLTAFSTVYDVARRLNEVSQGRAEGVIYGLSEEQAKKLSHHAAFSETNPMKYGFVGNMEHMRLPDPDIDELEQTVIYENGGESRIWSSRYLSPENGTELLPDKQLSEGRLPLSDSEIVLPYGGVAECDIGDKVTLRFRAYRYAEDGSREKLLLRSYLKEYTVCGFSNTERAFVHPDDGMIFGAVMNVSYCVYVRFADKSANLSETLEKACSDAGVVLTKISDNIDLYNGGSAACGLNESLLFYEAAGSEARSKLIVNLAAVYVIVLIILASGRMMIDCEFEVTAAKKQQQLGLLMSIGAEDRQLVSIVTFEGLILGAAAVPMGLAVGYLLTALACRAISADESVSRLLDGMRITPVTRPLYLILAAVTGIGWVFFSAYGTAVRIKKLDPNDAVKGYVKKGRLPYPKRPYKKSGKAAYFLDSIVYSTVCTEKKRFISSAAAVTASMTLFVGINTGVWVLDRVIDKALEDTFSVDFELCGNMTPDERDSLTEKLYGSGYFKDYPEFLADENVEARWYGMDMFGRTDAEGSCFINGMDKPTEVQMYGRDRYLMASYGDIAESGITYDEMNGGNIALLIAEEGDAPFEDGEEYSMTPTFFDGVHTKKLDMPEMRFTVRRIGSGIFAERPDSARLYVTKEFMDNYRDSLREKCPGYFESKDIYYFYLALRDKSDKADRAAAEELIKSTGYSYYSGYEYFVPYYAMKTIIRVTGAAVMAVSALIAAANIVNVTVSGINGSRRSYALLRAAGMTDSQLEKTAVKQSAVPAAASSVISPLLTAIIMLILRRLPMDELREIICSAEAALTAAGYYLIAAAAAIAISLMPAAASLREIEDMSVSDGVRYSE